MIFKNLNMMKKLLQSIILLTGILALPAAAHAQGAGGDVNGDLETNIADVNAVIDIILDGEGMTAAADVNRDGEINIADINAIIDIILGGDVPTPDYVDLGLPSGTLWATRNVYALTPEDYGAYFAWGETEPKVSYDLETYKWYESDDAHSGFTKYCVQDGYNGYFDNVTELYPDDDAAWAHYPDGRIPTKEQMQELCDNCTWQWTQRNGVDGQLVTGPNGNTLFLPASGSRKEGTLYSTVSRGYYWSRTVRADYSPHAWALGLKPDGWFTRYSYDRIDGFAIRAVRISRADLYIVQDNLDMGRLPIGETGTAELTIVNHTSEVMTLARSVDAPFSFRQDEGSAASITIEVPGNSRQTVTVSFTATAQGFYNSNITFQNPALDGGQNVIPISAHAVVTEASPEDYVDLGLPSGTLWATRNVCAHDPEDYGAYFAWGETEPKESYDWDTYKWGSSYSNLTKYVTDSRYGTKDNKAILDPADDAACVHYPGGRMPTGEQILELRNNCTWEWIQRYGVNGLLVTGSNGNSIFLPAAGWYWENTRYEENTYGIYWSLWLGQSPAAYSMEFGPDGWERLSMPERIYGFPIRAVFDNQNQPPVLKKK